MRTTVILDLDVSAGSRVATARLRLSLKQVINSALRIGLEEMLKREVSKPYRTEPRAMGLRRNLNYDNVAELLAIGQQKITRYPRACDRGVKISLAMSKANDETAYLMRSPANARRLLASMRSLEAGKSTALGPRRHESLCVGG